MRAWERVILGTSPWQYINEDSKIFSSKNFTPIEETLKKKPSEKTIMSGDATQPTTIRGSPTKYVKLNVGGSLHYTTIGTLSKQDSMLRAMFSGRMEVLTDTDGMFWHL